MEDAIDKRNLQDKIARTIIKRQNVHYMTLQEIEEKKRIEEKKKEAEAEKKRNQRKKDLESGYNRQTGSYSGAYGKEEIRDELTRGQIEKILGEKDESLRHMINHEE
ncbi:MAG: hypothetical protein ACI4HI_17310 [Lachnospiraceae bacterium]